MSEVIEDIIESVTLYHVSVKHDGVWVDMPGFTQKTEDEARDGAKVLADLNQEVKLEKVTTVVGERREELSI